MRFLLTGSSFIVALSTASQVWADESFNTPCDGATTFHCFQWTGTSSSNWNTAANWTTSTGISPPMGDSKAVIQLAEESGNTTLILSNTATIDALNEPGITGVGTTVQIASGGNLTINGLSNGTWLFNNGNSALTFDVDGGTVTVPTAGASAGGGFLTINIGQNNASTFNQAGTFGGIGVTNYSHGTINLSGTGSSGTGAFTNAGSMYFTGSSVIGQTGATTFSNTGALYFQQTTATTVGANITGAGTITLGTGSGAGTTITLNYAGNLGYTGLTTINTDGTLNIANGTGTPTAEILVSGILNVDGLLRSTNVLNQGTVNYKSDATAASGAIIYNGSTTAGTLNFASNSATNSNLTIKNGYNYASTTNFSAAYTSATGAPTIANGVNAVGTLLFQNGSVGAGTITNGASASNVGHVTFAGTGTATYATINNAFGYVDISGNTASSVTIGTLYGAAPVYLGSNTLTLQNTANQTISGIVQDNNASGTGATGGSLTYNGTSATTLTLSGANTYTGTTTVNAGTTINLTGSLATTSSLVNNGTFTMSNGSITLAGLSGSTNAAVISEGANTLTTTGNGTYSGSFSGTGGFTYNGSGNTLVFNNSGSLAYTGATTVTAGTLQIGDSTHTATSLAASSGVSISGTLKLYGLTGNSLTVNSGGNLQYWGSVSTAASATIANAGTLDISNWTGSNPFSVSTLTGNGNVSLGANTLKLNETQTLGGAFTDGGSGGGVTLAGGTLTFTSSGNTYKGATTINSGATLLLNNNLSNSTVVDNGTLNISGASGTVSIGGLSSTSSSIGTLGNNTLSIGGTVTNTYIGTISGAGGLTYAGSGTQILDGLNGYTGATTVSSGTLQIGDATHTGANAYITSSSGNISVASGAILSVYGQTFNGATNTASNAGTIQFLGGAGSGASTNFTTNTGLFDISSATAGVSIAGIGGTSGTGAVHLGANTLSIGANDSAVGGVISGVGGGITYTGGANTLTLAGINTYSGLTTATSGTIAITGSGSLASSAVNNNAAFDISGVTTGTTINGLYGTGTVNLGAKTLTVQGATQPSSYSGVMSGTGGALTYSGTGTLTLAGVNTYTGLTTISSGTLALNGSGAISSSAVNDNSAFDISGVTTSTTINGLYGTGTTNLGGKTLIVQGATQSSAYSGVMSGTGGALTYAGSGTLTLDGLNTYTGATTVSSGTLQIGDATHTGANAYITSSSGNISVASGATLSVYGQTFHGASNTASNAGTVQFLGGAGSGASTNFTTNTGLLDISSATAGVSIAGIGSASGTGAVHLGANTLSIGANTSAISGIISGTSGGITYIGGTNTLTLSGINTYLGLTTATSGTIAITGSGSLASSAVNNNAAFDISGVTTGTTINGLYGTGTVNLGSKILTVQGATQPSVYSGAMSGTGGALTYAGTGTLTLDGLNTYTGATTVSSGSLQIGDATHTGANAYITSSSGNISVASGATLSVYGQTFNGASNTASNAGTVQFLGGAGSGASTNFTTNTGLFDISSATAGVSIAGIGSASGTGGVHLGANTLSIGGNTSAVSGIISGVGGGITYAGGTNTLTLSGINTYSGLTTATSGTIALSGNGNIANSAVDNNAAFDISGVTTSATINGLYGTGTVNLGSKALTVQGATQPSSYSGVMSGAGTLTYAGTGTLTLAGANTYSGLTTISSGTLALSGSGVISSSSALNDNGTFDISGVTTSATINGLYGTGGTNLGSKTLIIQGATQPSAYSGAMSGTGGALTYLGTGTLTLDGLNTYTGATTVSSGTLQVGDATHTGSNAYITSSTGNISVASGATLSVYGQTFNGATNTASNAGTVQFLGGAGSGASTNFTTNTGLLDISSATGGVSIAGIGSASGTGAVHLGANTLSIGGNTSAVSGIISGVGGGITYAGGANTLTLSGVNTYSGLTTMTSGTIALSGNGSIANSAVDNNAAFDISGVTTSATINGLYGTGTVNLGNKALTVQGATQPSSYSGVMSGTGALTYAGTGTLTLAGDNTYSGLTTISSGTLALNGSGVISSSSALNDNGTFDISGVTTSATINGLYGTGGTNLGSKTLIVQGATQPVAYSGAMSGTGGALTYSGTGTLTLDGLNTYTGATTVSSGTLQIGDATYTGSSAYITSSTGNISVASGATLSVYGQTFNGASNTASNAGTVQFLGGAGSGASTNFTTNTGLLDISSATAGVSIAGIGSTSGTGAVHLGANTLSIGANTSAISGIVSGAGGGLTYAGGTNTLTLSGVNTYSGLTTVTSGTLALAGSGSIASSAVDDNGTFDISGATAATTISGLYGTGTVSLGNQTLTVQGATQPSAYSGVMSGTGALTYSGTGTLTLAGLNTYTGATTVSSGTLQIGDATHTGSNAYITSSIGDIAVASGATLSVYGQTFNGATNTASNAGTVEFLGGVGSGASTNFTTNTGILDISSATAGVSIAGIGSTSGTGAVHLGANTLSIGANTSAISGIISGNGGGVTYAGGGNTLTLSGANTYTGTTTVTSGAVALTGSLSSSSSLVNNAIFDMSGAGNTSITNLNGTSNSADVNLGSNTLTVAGSGSYYGILSGTGDLTYTGAGILTLGGANTFTGTATVSSGTLVLTGSVASTSNLTNNAVFDMSGATGDVTIVNFGGTNTAALMKLGSNNLIINGTDTYNGAISGTGQVTYSGTGTQVFNGANSFTGATTIASNGMLVLGQSASYSSAALQGDVSINASGTLQGYGTINGAVTNNGIIDNYYGMLTGAITNNNSFTLHGQTTSQLVNNGNAYYYNTANGTVIANNNYLEFNGATAATSAINNADTLHFVSGATAANSVITNTATVAFNDTSSSGSATINHNGGTLYFNDASTANGTTIASNGGVIDISGLTAASVTVGRLYGDTTINLGGNQLQVGALNTSDTISGTINGSFSSSLTKEISGGSFVKVGTGTLTLNTINAYSGTTTVQQGTLILGGDASFSSASLAGSAVVDAGAIFEGFGTIDGSLTNAGTVQPGNSVSSGTLTVLQNYVQTASGIYNLIIDPSTINMLAVTGQASLSGTLDIMSNNGTVQVGASVPFITASGGVTGQFSQVIEPRFLSLFIEYNSNDVSFTLSHNSTEIVSAAQTPNQYAVANYIINSGGNDAINSTLVAMTDDEEYRVFLDQMSGATYANQQMAIIHAGEQFENELLYRLNRDVWCFMKPNQTKPCCDEKNLWFALYSGKNQLLNTFEVSGLNTHVYGGALGSEITLVDNGIVGAAVSYSQLHEKTSGPEDAHTTGGLYQGAVYARYDYGNWRIGAEVDYGSTSNISAVRKIANTNTGTVETTAEYQTPLFGSQIVTSYDISFWGMSFRPTAGVIYQRVNGLNFSEDSDTSFELRVMADAYQSTRSQLGLSFDTGFFTYLHPIFYAAWEHEFSDLNVNFNANIIGLPDTFYIQGTQIGRNSVYVDAGIALLQCANVDFTVNYQGRFANQFNHNAIMATMAF
jgi:autotransporter-associated beta strand protein